MNMMEAFLDGVSLIAIAKTVFAFAPLILPAAAGGPTDYRIARSLRFRSGNSGYLSRTPSGGGDRQKFTWSGWVKKANNGSTIALFSARQDDSNRFHLAFSGDTLSITSVIAAASSSPFVSSALYRDNSAWMHVALAVDTTQATAANRMRIYVNGVEITNSGTAVTQNTNLFVNVVSTAHAIGRVEFSTPANYFEGYLADVHFVDGQQLTPSNFGAFDAVTGVWNPKVYTGTYGTNGFRLDFADNSAATAGAIGADRSGNGNNWTPTNISVTAGVTNDSFVDSPTNYGSDSGLGGEVRGNYTTLNFLDKGSNVTLTGGNLDYANTASQSKTRAAFEMSSGKWYWEMTAGSINTLAGIATLASVLTNYCGQDAASYGYFGDGLKYNSASGTSYGATFTTNDVIGVAYDADNGKLYFRKNGTWQNSGDPVAGTGAAFTGLSGGYYPAISGVAGGANSGSLNFGQRAFSNSAPTGFKALCTQNLPDPAIKKPSQYFDVNLRTGTGAAGSVTGKLFQPDLLWTKGRSSAVDHTINDSGRGVGAVLRTNTTGAETTGSPSNDGITLFNSDGFSFGANANSGTGHVNVNAVTYVDWMWKEGATPGFSRVTYTGNGAVRTIAHSLGVAPDLIIVKSRSAVSNWFVWHRSVTSGNGKYLYLELTNALGGPAGTPVWDSNDTTTQSSSSVFSIGANTGVNTNAATYVAYLFANVPGFSKFGSYTGNASADGPFVNCGFRPRWIMMKMTSSTGGWFLFDAARSDYNVADDYLQANTASVEGTFASVDFLSNGFKLKAAASDPNTSAATYIYAAFAENPFKYARAR